MESKDACSPPSGWALLPFAVFALFYVGISLWANDFYKVSMPVAFLVASAAALMLNRREPLERKVDVFAAGMGEVNIMIMCLVFILAGAFAAVTKGMGAVDAAVTIAQALVPARLMLAGVFLVSCLISLAVGTSCGTIAAVGPIALGFAGRLELAPALLLGAVVGGAMFGDNLSMISDTTIAATRTQGVRMKDKFVANFFLAVPAALAALVLYVMLGSAADAGASVAVTWRHLVLVAPYVLVFALALCGLNVMLLLFAGTALAVAIGVCLEAFPFLDGLVLCGKGTLGMSETLIVAILAGGLFRVVRANGGVAWLTARISSFVKGPRSCEFGVFLLTALVNAFTANNTVAIVIAGPVAKVCADRFGARPVRIAAVLDGASCVVQGLIPYGAQLLIAVGVARAEDMSLGSFELIKALYYPPLLAFALVVSMLLPRFMPRRD